MLPRFQRPADQERSLIDRANIYNKESWVITLMHHISDRNDEKGAKILQPCLIVEGVRSQGAYAYLFYFKQNKTLEFCCAEGLPKKDILAPQGVVHFMSYSVNSLIARKLVRNLLRCRGLNAISETTQRAVYTWFKEKIIQYFDSIRCPDTHELLLTEGSKKGRGHNANIEPSGERHHMTGQGTVHQSVHSLMAAVDAAIWRLQNPKYNDLSHKPFDNIQRADEFDLFRPA